MRPILVLKTNLFTTSAVSIINMAEKNFVPVSETSPDDGNHVAIKTDTFAIDIKALGQNLPKNYYRSIGFIGTVIVGFFI